MLYAVASLNLSLVFIKDFGSKLNKIKDFGRSKIFFNQLLGLLFGKFLQIPYIILTTLIFGVQNKLKTMSMRMTHLDQGSTRILLRKGKLN